MRLAAAVNLELDLARTLVEKLTVEEAAELRPELERLAAASVRKLKEVLDASK